MASRVGDASGARRLGRALDGGAGELGRIERELDRAVSGSSCRGGFIGEQARRVRALATLGGSVERRMRETAVVVRRHAEWVEETERELRDLERRIRFWAATHPAGDDPLSVEPDASLITYWPAPLSFEWRDLAARLRAHGVWF